VRAVGVAYVEPKRAGRHQYTLDLYGDIHEFAHPLIDVAFEAELAASVVVA
jgi:hypothetical protein